MSHKVLLLENIHPLAKGLFEKAGLTVDLEIGSLPEEELSQRLKAYDVVGIRSKTQMTEKVISENTHLAAIGCFCIGTNQVQLDSAVRAGVPVFNAPYSNTRSVAELVIAEVISLSRHLFSASQAAHTGGWQKTAGGRKEVRGKNLGIVGYGHIGSQVSVLAEAMGLNVYYFDTVKKLPLGNATSLDSLDELLKISDFVTLHVPETPETKQMMGQSQLQKMKPGASLINASRGSVVVIEDLAAELKSGHLAGAAVDVFPQEPKNNKESFSSSLQGIENVILTPHIGGSTEEAQQNIGQEVAQSLLNYVQVGSSYGAVQFPQVDVPVLRGDSQRLVNIHKNVPGVLGEINSIVSEKGINIRAQYLSTNSDVGYMVMDTDASADIQSLCSEVQGLSSSIKTHVRS